MTYLTKGIADCNGDFTGAGHTDRMVEALKFEPRSRTCADWLSYGVQLKTLRYKIDSGQRFSAVDHVVRDLGGGRFGGAGWSLMLVPGIVRHG